MARASDFAAGGTLQNEMRTSTIDTQLLHLSSRSGIKTSGCEVPVQRAIVLFSMSACSSRQYDTNCNALPSHDLIAWNKQQSSKSREREWHPGQI
jgi:hypothetical protein